MLASSALHASADAAADAAVRTLVAALRPRERLPTLEAGTPGTRALWQALLCNYSPGALQQAQHAHAEDAAAEVQLDRAAEYEGVHEDHADRAGMLRKWLQAQGFAAPREPVGLQLASDGGSGAAAAAAGGMAALPDMRMALTLPELRRREAVLRAADRGDLAALAACVSVFWLCGEAVENPEQVARYAVEAKERRMQSHCQELTLRMLGSLSKRLKEARRARQPLRPRHPRSGVRPPVATRRRVVISDKAAADSARPVALRSGSIAADGAAAAVCTGNQSAQCGRASGGSGIPPLKPDSSSFQEWHGALDSAYAVMKGMLGGLSMDAVHAAHAPILLLSFDASKMATQLQRATSDLCRLQVAQAAALEGARRAVSRFCRLMHARSKVQHVVATAASSVRLRRLAVVMRAAGAAVAERRLQAAHRSRAAAMCRGIITDIAAAAAARAAFPAAVRAVMRRRVELYARRVVCALADAAVHGAALREEAKVAASAAAATARWVVDARAGHMAAEQAAMRRWVRRLVVALVNSTAALSRHQSRLIAEGIVDDLVASAASVR